MTDERRRYCVACGAERTGTAACHEHGEGAMAEYIDPARVTPTGPGHVTGVQPARIPVDEIIAYENGDLDEDAIVSLFQKLVDNGMAWTLQGAYGRMATRLIEAGLVTRRNR